jgi:hypothetical protein
MFLQMLVDFRQTAQNHIPGDITLHNHHCQNSNPDKLIVSCLQALLLMICDWLV